MIKQRQYHHFYITRTHTLTHGHYFIFKKGEINTIFIVWILPIFSQSNYGKSVCKSKAQTVNDCMATPKIEIQQWKYPEKKITKNKIAKKKRTNYVVLPEMFQLKSILATVRISFVTPWLYYYLHSRTSNKCLNHSYDPFI